MTKTEEQPSSPFQDCCDRYLPKEAHDVSFFVDPLPCMLKMYSLEGAIETSYPTGRCIQVPETIVIMVFESEAPLVVHPKP